MIVANRGGYPSASATSGRRRRLVEEPRSLGRLDGDNAVSLVVQKQSRHQHRRR